MGAMDASKHELIEGLGLCVLAVIFTGAMLTAAVVAIGHGNHMRAVGFGAVGLVGAYFTTRFTQAQFATYRAAREEERAGRRSP